MANGCRTCRHCGNDIERDPCRGCTFGSGFGSNWEPAGAGEILPDWYQAQAVRTAGRRVRNDGLLYAAVRMCDKSAGIANLAEDIVYRQKDAAAELIRELGEMQRFVALAADALGISMGEVMARSIEEMRERSPEAFGQE